MVGFAVAALKLMIGWIFYQPDQPESHSSAILVVSLSDSHGSESALASLLSQSDRTKPVTGQTSWSVPSQSGTVLVTSSNLWSIDPKWPENDMAVPMMREALQASAPAPAQPALKSIWLRKIEAEKNWCLLGGQIMKCLSTSTNDEPQAVWSDLKAARKERVKHAADAAQAVCSSAAVKARLMSKANTEKAFHHSLQHYALRKLDGESLKFAKLISEPWSNESAEAWSSIDFDTVDNVELQERMIKLFGQDGLSAIIVQQYCNTMQPWPVSGVLSPTPHVLTLSCVAVLHKVLEIIQHGKAFQLVLTCGLLVAWFD